MSAPAPSPAPSEMSVLELLFMTLELTIETLGPESESQGIADSARDLQDMITSYWQVVHGVIEDEDLPF